MTSTTGEEKKVTFLKTDRLGRVCVTRERREELLGEFERSGLSGAEFAALVGVKYSTFSGWRQRRDRESKSASESPSGSPLHLVEAVVESSGGEDAQRAVVIELPGNARMEFSHAAQVPLVSALLKSLERC
jgi:hypothetical protein